jgi:hypothetical protein
MVFSRWLKLIIILVGRVKNVLPKDWMHCEGDMATIFL